MPTGHAPSPSPVPSRLRRLHKRNERLEDQNARLKRELTAALRAGRRQAAPFAKTRARNPRRPGRRAGADYGVAARRPRPSRVDERHDAPLPPACPDCGGSLRPTRVATQVQEELPVLRVVVREFQVAIGACRACGRRVQGRHRLQSSDALGAAGVQLGPQAVAWAAILNKQLGLSFGKVATLLQQHYGLRVSRSGLVHAVDRAARQAQATYADLQQQLRRSPVVTPDETGWKVAGRLNWLWVAATAQTTVYAIQPGRGYRQAAALLGPDFAGVIVRDGWAPYRRFTAATHQSCLAHLLRRGRTLRTDHPHSRRDTMRRLPAGSGGLAGSAPAPHCAPVAQLDRAPGFEPVGRGFKSLRARHLLPPLRPPTLLPWRPA